MADYFEIVLDGDTNTLRGFVAGYLAASGLDGEVYAASECHVEHDSLARQFAEWAGLVADRTHLIVSARVREALIRGMAQPGEQLGIKVVDVMQVAEARFGFSWKTFSREEAGQLRKIFANVPAGVALDDYAPVEKVHEDEKGQTGAYAPVHPFEATARGVAHGAPGAVILWAAELRENKFVELEDITLTHAD